MGLVVGPRSDVSSYYLCFRELPTFSLHQGNSVMCPCGPKWHPSTVAKQCTPLQHAQATPSAQCCHSRLSAFDFPMTAARTGS